MKTVLETRSNQPSPLEGVVYFIWCIINVAINIKVTFVRHHWTDKTKPFIYILRMLHIVCKKWLAVSQTLSRFFQSLFNNIILLWRPIAEYGQSNEPLAHAVLTASIQSYLLWSIDREGGFRMTVGPGGSQLLYLCHSIRGPLYCNQNTAEQLRKSI